MIKILLAILGLLLMQTVAFPESNVSIVNCNKEIGRTNKMVFGSNLVGYDPATIKRIERGSITAIQITE